MEKVKIIFDNNLSITGKDNPIANIFSSNVYKLKEFIVKNKIDDRALICLTETFREEGVAELQRRAISKYQDAKKLNFLLKDILEDTFITEINEKELEEKIEKQFNLKIKELNIEILPLPAKTSVLELSGRAIGYVPPFEIGDKGFKDTLAWISILEDSVENTDFNYILVSKDNIFNDSKLKQEFTKHSKRQIIITPAEPIEEILDNVLGMGIGLNKIKQDVILDLNNDISFQNQLANRALKSLNESKNIGFASRYLLVGSYGVDWKSKVVNLIFSNADISIKGDIKKDLFEVEAEVVFQPKYADLDEKKSGSRLRPGSLVADYTSDTVSIYGFGAEYNHFPELLKQKFILSYSKKNGFKILSIDSIEPNSHFNYFNLS